MTTNKTIMTTNKAIKAMTRKSARLIIMALALATGGCSLFGGGDDPAKRVEAAEEVFQIGVNAYLWRATLDTLSFMPIKSADNNGGVILTDWKVNPSNDKERTKVDIIITGKTLSADSLDVRVYRQGATDTGWKDEEPRPGASINISKAILIQAKLLRRNNAPIK